MLAEADTIQKAKELKSLALTAADWARRKNMGEGAIRHCRSYALEAERKLGQMLLATGRAKGAKGQLRGSTDGGRSGGHLILPPEKREPTLADLGLSKTESAAAQALARLSEADFVAVVGGTLTRKAAIRKARMASHPVVELPVVDIAANKVVAKYPVVELPIADIVVNKDVQNFKADADPETGVVPGEELSGEYVRLGTAPIVVWLRLDGSMEIITGRHRLELARRMGEKTIPAQIVCEADGFGQADASTLDAQSNIRDGQGTIEDYAHYFKNPPALTEAEARMRGLLSRAKGRDGWELGKNASVDLYAIWWDKKITTEKAVAIARAAPGNVALQALGIKQAVKGRSPTEIENFIKAVQSQTGGTAEQVDLFGRDDTAIKQAEQMAAKATKRQNQITEEIRAVQGAAKRPEIARELGVDVKDPQGIIEKVGELKSELGRWENWPQHPDLMAKVKGGTPE